MKICPRCDKNVPDFLWAIDGSDHPVLLPNQRMIVNRSDHFEDNTARFTVTIKTSRRMCSDVFPTIMEDEYLELQGHRYLVIHLAGKIPENGLIPPPGLFVAACTGKYARFVPDKDSRLHILCEDCKKIALEDTNEGKN